MSDLITVQSGPERSPWHPSPDAELRNAYHVWDIPLAGHLREGTSDYFFWCVDGAANDTVSLWAYAQVSESEIQAVEQGEFDAQFAKAIVGKPLTVALYNEERGIVASIIVLNPDQYRSVGDAIVDELRYFVREIEERKRAETTRELVEA